MNNQNQTPSNPPYAKGEDKNPSSLDAREVRRVVDAIDARPNKHLQKMIGIDGLGASGKTTIAEGIKQLHPETSIIHLEDFYKPQAERTEGVTDQAVSPDFDWDRFEDFVIKPVRRNLMVKYRRFDWRADRWTDPLWIEIPPTHWIIIVGVYALQSRFFTVYDYTIWMEVPKEIRLRRMIEREGESVAQEWLEKWSPREENYLAIDAPDKRATSTILANTSG